MNEVDYISIETAELAKEKGFDWAVSQWYGKLNDNPFIMREGIEVNWNTFSNRISLPTQAILQRWLRTKGIVVYVEVAYYDGWNIMYNIVSTFTDKTSDKEYNTWEEALEDGLKEALKLI